jgi:hypothetical protein
VNTYKKGRLYLLDPRPEEIDIEDIAHQLSMINRFVGATQYPYNVAEHSCLVSQEVYGIQYRLEALLHDAHEAYTGDMVTPLKRQMGLSYMVLEDAIDIAIRNRFNLPTKISPEVKRADGAVFLSEAARLMPGREWSYMPDVMASIHQPTCLYHVAAEDNFLEYFNELGGNIG